MRALLYKRTGACCLQNGRSGNRAGAVLLSLQKRTGACCAAEVGVARQENGAAAEKLTGRALCCAEAHGGVLCAVSRARFGYIVLCLLRR